MNFTFMFFLPSCFIATECFFDEIQYFIPNWASGGGEVVDEVEDKKRVLSIPATTY